MYIASDLNLQLKLARGCISTVVRQLQDKLQALDPNIYVYEISITQDGFVFIHGTKGAGAKDSFSENVTQYTGPLVMKERPRSSGTTVYRGW